MTQVFYNATEHFETFLLNSNRIWKF